MRERSDIDEGDEPGRSPLRPLEPGVRLGTAVYDELLRRLIEGHYPAGSPLRTEALRLEFGVSKQPIMEALRRLSADRLVEIVPQVGCEVLEYTQGEVEDFFAMFGSFEGAIAAAAAQRRTDRQMADLERINERIGALRADPDPVVRSRGYRADNRKFHAKIHQMAHSQIMVDMSQRMWNMSDFLINTAGEPLPIADALDSRHDDHERVLDALRQRDADRAHAEMRDHIVKTVDIIRQERDPEHAASK